MFYNKRTTHIWTAAMSTARSNIFILKTIMNKYCKNSHLNCVAKLLSI